MNDYQNKESELRIQKATTCGELTGNALKEVINRLQELNNDDYPESIIITNEENDDKWIVKDGYALKIDKRKCYLTGTSSIYFDNDYYEKHALENDIEALKKSKARQKSS